MIARHRMKLPGVTALPALLLALLPAACLEVSDQEPPMCKVTADCDSGEVCDEQVCWGNPPAGALAAVISPPSERADLVSREVLALPITGDGWIDDVHLDNAVAFKGRLRAQCEQQALCDSRPLGAKITITRPSVFNGGPGFNKVVEVDDASFDINVPATQPGDAPFTITVEPSDRALPGSGTSLARVLPPMQTRLAIAANVGDNVLELGEIGLPKVYGRVATLSGAGLAGYRVVAFGRWAPDQPLVEVSTVAFTQPDGTYQLRLARGLIGNVEIVARPYDAQLRPELRLVGVEATRDSINNVLLVPSLTTGSEVAVDVVVDHKDTGGEIAPVGGARVTISGGYAVTAGSMRFTAEGTTGDDGVVHLKLLDLTQLVQSYKLSIIPPPSSTAAALFEKPYTLATTSSQRLGTRIAVTGTVLNADGQPLKGVSVTARPSVRFLWSLEAAPQAFLGAVPAATMVTPDTGEFVLFVDQALTTSGSLATTVWGHYDLSFEPSMKTRAPSWTWTNVELPRDDAQSTLALGEVRLPDAAYVRGFVYDDENAHVEGADVKIYRVQTDEALCQETRFEPPSCPIPPLLLGRGASADDGVARLNLPR